MTDETEPRGSASSSPDEPRCQCGHSILCHDKLKRRSCAGAHACDCWDFAPAEPDRKAVFVSRLAEMCWGTTDEDEPEPEAPEEPSETLQRAAQRAREMIQRPLRRPPYAVAYAVQGGAQYEIALPGDATVRAIDGALIITHDSAVLALVNVRPMGAEEGA